MRPIEPLPYAVPVPAPSAGPPYSRATAPAGYGSCGALAADVAERSAGASAVLAPIPSGNALG